VHASIFLEHCACSDEVVCSQVSKVSDLSSALHILLGSVFAGVCAACEGCFAVATCTSLRSSLGTSSCILVYIAALCAGQGFACSGWVLQLRISEDFCS
jgi:hypothetical protein